MDPIISSRKQFPRNQKQISTTGAAAAAKFKWITFISLGKLLPIFKTHKGTGRGKRTNTR